MTGKELMLRPAGRVGKAGQAPPWQDERPELVPAYRWLWRRRHWTVPVITPAAMWLAAYFVHAAHGAGYAAAALGVLAACVWVFAPHKWTDSKGRPQMREVWYARGSALGGGAWVAAAAQSGPAGSARIVLGCTLAVVCGAWGVLWWLHKRPRGHRRRRKLIGECDAWWQSYAFRWRLGGSRVIDAWQIGDVALKMRVKGRPGVHSFRDVQAVAHLIDSALQGAAPPGMARVEPDPRDASCWFLLIKREDPLDGDVEWDPTLVPASVTGLAPIAVREGGGWKMVSLRGGWFILGRSRSGKSNELSVLLAPLTEVPDAIVWLIDRKGGRSARPWLPAVDWVATTIEEARIMLSVAEDEVRARGEKAYFGTEQLEPAPDVPAIFIVIDEAGQVTADPPNGDRECQGRVASIASMGQGVAVELIIATQYGRLETSVGTEQTRANLLHRLAFATEKPEHAEFALGGNCPDTSKLDKKGSFYYKEGPDRPLECHRGPKMDHDLVREIAARNSEMLRDRPPLRLYASHRQAEYDSRWDRLPESFRDGSPQYQERAGWLRRTRVNATPDGFQAAPAPAPVPAPAPGEGSAAAAAARIAQELDEAYSVAPDAPPPDGLDLGTELARGRTVFCTALQAAHQGITPRELVRASGMSRSWVMARLKELAERGAVTKPPGGGVYTPSEGADISQELAGIYADEKRLLRQAAAVNDAAA